MMMRPALIFLAIAAATPAAAQTDPTLQSYRRAQRVVARALAAHGGAPALMDVRSIQFRLEGWLHHRHQSQRAEGVPDSTPWRATGVVDYAGNRALWLRSSEYPGGFAWTFVDLVARDSTFGLRSRDRLVLSRRAGGRAGALGTLPARLIHQQLLELAAIGGELRYEGRREIRGARHERVVGLGRTWSFDARSGLLARIEEVQPDGFAGDIPVATVFDDYRRVGTMMLPERRTTWRDGTKAIEERFLDLAVNETIADSVMAIGDAAPGRPPAPRDQWHEVAPGIHVVSNPGGTGYNVLVATLRDYAVMIDAPGNPASVLAILRSVEERTGRRVRYVVPTHHHDDHAGGLRGAIAAGATIVTTPGNAALFRRIAAAQPTIAPDSLARAPRPLALEIVTGGRRVFSDGATSIEILDIGPNPHTDEMLVGWVPAAGLVFQGDLLNAASLDDLGDLQATRRAFGAWIVANGLSVRHIAGVHSPIVPVELFQRHLAGR